MVTYLWTLFSVTKLDSVRQSDQYVDQEFRFHVVLENLQEQERCGSALGVLRLSLCRVFIPCSVAQPTKSVCGSASSEPM